MEHSERNKYRGKDIIICPQRPIFYFNQKNMTKPCKAGGVIPYILREDKIIYLLLIKCRDRYEDFGGKTEPGDESIKETIAREAWEESNYIIPKEYTLHKTKGYGAYILKCKYLLFFMKAQIDYDTSCFGDTEKHENIIRTVEWVPITMIDKNFNLHPRLKSREFFDLLSLLQLNIK